MGLRLSSLLALVAAVGARTGAPLPESSRPSSDDAAPAPAMPRQAQHMPPPQAHACATDCPCDGRDVHKAKLARRAARERSRLAGLSRHDETHRVAA
jgi:hypothetical protein